VKTCLGNSLNVPAVKVEVATGVPYITSLEIAAGITTYQNPNDRPGPTEYSATLGGFPVTPLELADGAATLADLGVHHDPSPVDRIIVRSTAQKLFTLNPDSTARRVVPENVAFIINEITSNDANRVMDFGAHGPLTLPDRRVSAKTGTAEYFNDNWTIGWTPDIVTAVWVGNPSGSCLAPADRARMQNAINHGHVLFTGMDINYPFSPADLAQYGMKPNPRIATSCGHLDSSDGVTGAAPIWHKDMVTATALFSASDWYTMPKDVTAVGTGDNADFFLPGTQATGSGGPCYYWGPPGTPAPPTAAPTPQNPSPAPCVYTGTGPPAANPEPAPIPTPNPPQPTRKPHH
jgi:membrane peptidoglycan carboxypeptidase